MFDDSEWQGLQQLLDGLDEDDEEEGDKKNCDGSKKTEDK